MVLARLIDEVYRRDGRRLLAGLIRLCGDFDLAEDALQEACARALVAWRREAVPASPGAWLNTVSRRILIDGLRRNPAARARQTRASGEEPSVAPHEWVEEQAIEDDLLRLLFTCCHPALPPMAQATLALRALGGLSTKEIARAFVEPETATAQRIVRAKRRIRELQIPYQVPGADELAERSRAVLEVIYLIFNEGYTSREARSLIRPDLAREAIRLARLCADLLPDLAEARGLLALLLLTDSRRSARLSAELELVTLDQQDRSLWDQAQISEGQRVLDGSLALGSPGPYQIQAAIAALHATATDAAATDWRQIATLYQALIKLTPTPVVELNAAVALGFATRMEAALAWITQIEESGALAGYYLLPAAKAGVLMRMGRNADAALAFGSAIGLTSNPVEQRYLEGCREAVQREFQDPIRSASQSSQRASPK